MTGRDDARAHPSLDELADLREGLLPAVDEDRVRAHLTDCAECAAGAAALDDVATALRGVAEPISMPSSVAREIDRALAEASAGRAASPTTPEPVPSSGSRGRRHGWVKPAFGWLAGVAAAVVVIGGVGAGLGSLGSSSDDSASGGGGASDASAEGSPPQTSSRGDGATPGKSRPVPRALDEATIQGYALRLSDAPVATASGPTSGNDWGGGSYERLCRSPQGMGGLARPVIWHGRDALLVVKREKRLALVYSCDTTPRRLYSTPY